MTGRRPLDEAELIERLGDLSGALAWPTTPDLAGRVSAALEAGAAWDGSTLGVLERLRRLVGIGGIGAAAGRRVARRSLVIALVALLAIVVAAAAIGLGVPGIRIDLRQLPSPNSTPPPTPTLSTPAPSSSTALVTPSPTTRATPPGQELGLTVSLDEARAAAGFGLLLPTAIGYADPAEVHVIGGQPFTRVALRYANQTLLTEFLGEMQPDAFQKIVGGGTMVTPVAVGTADGFWIEGAPHELVLLFRDPDGQIRWQEVTITGNVLLWQVGGVTLRLETALDRATAIDVATSLR